VLRAAADWMTDHLSAVIVTLDGEVTRLQSQRLKALCRISFQCSAQVEPHRCGD